MNTSTRLDQKTATEIGGALAKLQELNSKKILETSDAAEKRGLQAFIASTVSAHASELIGAWFVVHNEYAPLVRGFAGLISRASGMSQQQPSPEK